MHVHGSGSHATTAYETDFAYLSAAQSLMGWTRVDAVHRTCGDAELLDTVTGAHAQALPFKCKYALATEFRRDQ